ncbi:MAG: hypothetical protein CMJ48_00420 [Planctomycetaceae bacterium]|nr:hypothetical protein [Planctomycetaceae bacterium]
MSAPSPTVCKGACAEFCGSRIAGLRFVPRGFTFLISTTCLLLISVQASAATITLDFATLPSAQGWIFSGEDIGGGPLLDSDVYSVDGTTLTQDMVGGDGDDAQYRLLGALDAGMSTTLRLRARVTDYEPGSGASFGLGFQVTVYDGAWVWQLIFTDEQVGLTNSARFDVDTSVFHDYRLEMRPDGTADLLIDDVLRESSTGNAIGFNAVVFGDSASSGENADAEITEFSLTQSRAVVPEPATLTLWVLGAVGLVGFGWRRRKRAA